MKIIGNAQFADPPSAVYTALNDPAVLVRCIPGCHRLEALGDDAYTMTVAAGVGSIKGVYDGQVRLTDHDEPASFRLHADGAGAAGTIGADVHVTLEPTDAGGTSVTYDADATVGGMIGGVGQRMLVGVSKRMAAEFFGNVETTLAAGVPGSAHLSQGGEASTPSGASRLPPGTSTDAPPPSVRSAASAAPPGAVFTADRPVGVDHSAFARGVTVGAAAALAGAVVGAWISRRAAR
jgi:carbon monoxide dehydrogenase subunit G